MAFGTPWVIHMFSFITFLTRSLVETLSTNKISWVGGPSWRCFTIQLSVKMTRICAYREMAIWLCLPLRPKVPSPPLDQYTLILHSIQTYGTTPFTWHHHNIYLEYSMQTCNSISSTWPHYQTLSHCNSITLPTEIEYCNYRKIKLLIIIEV